jgi:hypothetical protein
VHRRAHLFALAKLRLFAFGRRFTQQAVDKFFNHIFNILRDSPQLQIDHFAGKTAVTRSEQALSSTNHQMSASSVLNIL